MLAAGLDGIKRGLTPPEPVNRNIYHMTEEESVELGIGSLPHDLSHALDALEADDVMRQALGDHIFTRVHPPEARGVGVVQRAGARLGDPAVHGSLLSPGRAQTRGG